MQPIDDGELFNIQVIINDVEYSLNDDTATNASVIAEDETEAPVIEEVLMYII